MTGTDLRAEGLTKSFGSRRAIDAVDLEVRPGRCFGFLGPNGAGKTTLIRLMLGLARPDAGRALIGGIDVAVEPARALARVGAIVEEPRFHRHLTGVESLRVHAPLVGGAEAEARIPRLLARVGLSDRGDDRVGDYSMGMRQRLGLARALLGDPSLLLLDEPTNGLDAEGVAGFRLLVRGMVEDEGRTVFLSSHLLDEMQRLCDDVAIVEQGRVVTQAAVADLLAGTQHVVLVDCDDPARAAALLAADGVETAPAGRGLLRVTLPPGRGHAIALNRRLVEAGIGVAGLRAHAESLEQRYLALTGGGAGGGGGGTAGDAWGGAP